jgi:dTDP-4-dehydrorhamnose reductase
MESKSNSTICKVLVTGANGQLGSELKELAEFYSNLNFVFTDIDSLDITNSGALKSFFRTFKPDYVINCAAYTAVDRAEEDKENAALLNAKAPMLLALAAEEHNFKLIQISTDYVFNGRTWEPYNEEHPTSPNSIYGSTKLEGEKAVLKSKNAMVIRTSWLYSSHGNNFVKTIAKKGRSASELRVVYDQVGSPTWANDLARAILDIISKGKSSFIPEVFHYSNEGVCSWYDFAKEIVSFFDLSCKIIPILSFEYPMAASRPPYSVLNKSKIKEQYKLQIPHWKDSMINCLKLIKLENL